ncbi:MAG: hypothetical protein PHF86_14735 [Candidatus Nanoarchaeia archaeon]|nr:hypothetical protein [Candidatus Nanoarchaeia archaeon]
MTGSIGPTLKETIKFINKCKSDDEWKKEGLIPKRLRKQLLLVLIYSFLFFIIFIITYLITGEFMIRFNIINTSLLILVLFITYLKRKEISNWLKIK